MAERALRMREAPGSKPGVSIPFLFRMFLFNIVSVKNPTVFVLHVFV